MDPKESLESEAKDAKSDNEFSQAKLEDRRRNPSTHEDKAVAGESRRPAKGLKSAGSKNVSLSSVQPDGKRDDTYWKGADGVLKRATAFLYRRIISSREEGGMKDFFEEHCELFKGIGKGEEQSLEFMPLYREYESLVDQALTDFAQLEGLSEEDLGETVQVAVRGGTLSANRGLSMLVAAGDYRKFITMMATRAREAS
mmetsp:Transcript_29051/g.59419  ORF Transcript_29051/g.59419 Transcript_29051/m.59419 type:complete len:199 (-) Transcript_29051:200-796(-)